MPKTIRFFTLCFFALALSASATAQVYKHVDEAGNVTYSDAPKKKGEQPIELPETTTIKLAPAPATSANEGDKTAPMKIKTVEYDSVEIVSPATDETIRSNSGDITVQVRSSPGLQGNHVYVVSLDGARQPLGTASSITLNNLDRGSHTVIAHIQDQKEQTLASSAPITFHLFRATVNKSKSAPPPPPKKKPALK